MDLTRRHLLKGAAPSASPGPSPALSPGPRTPRRPRGRSWRLARAGTSSFFDPHMSTSSNDIRVSFNVFDNLTSRHPDGKLNPGLATEWKLEGRPTWRSSCARA